MKRFSIVAVTLLAFFATIKLSNADQNYSLEAKETSTSPISINESLIKSVEEDIDVPASLKISATRNGNDLAKISTSGGSQLTLINK